MKLTVGSENDLGRVIGVIDLLRDDIDIKARLVHEEVVPEYMVPESVNIVDQTSI